MDRYDLIIIGAGPAGLTSGIYAARDGLKVAIISKDIGGTTNLITSLENWPGFKGTGSELIKKIYSQIKEYQVDFILDDVQNISKSTTGFKIKTKKKELNSKTVILANGTERKKLNVKGEKEFIGKGISYCVTCDGFFYKNKIAAVIGGSDCAAISALTLADLTKKTYVIYRGGELRCEQINSKRLAQRKNVEVLYDAIPMKIEGDKLVNSLTIKHKGKTRVIKVDGIFIEVGATPLVDLIKNLGVKTNKENYIMVDELMKTSTPGVFAAGDITNHKLKQVIISAGQGALAANSACDYIKNGGK